MGNNSILDGSFKNSENPLSYQTNCKYSFREGGGLYKISIIPNEDELFNEDFGNNIIGATKESVLGSIPSVLIREYQPDMPQDQWINIFKEAYKQTTDIIKSGATSTETMKKLYEKLKDGSAIETILKSCGITELGDDKAMLYGFPHMLYRKLIGYTTNNWYEVPFSGTTLMQTNGSQGWRQNSLRQQWSSFANFKNINISYRPIWSLDNVDGPSFEVEFNLYNDTEERLMDNFTMIHSLLPNSTWTQYGILQSSPSLYDVKIQGGFRFFMCAADMTCSFIGNVRKPYSSLINRLNINNKDKKNIRIPDVYNVKIQFKSLLPQNFNTYILEYAVADDVFDDGPDGAKGDSVYPKLVEAIGKIVKDSATEAATLEQVNKDQEKLEELKQQEEDNNGKIKDAEESLNKNQSEIDSINNEIGDLNEKLEKAQTDGEKREINQEISEATTALASKQENVAQTKKELESLQGKQSQLTQDKEKVQQSLNEGNEKLNKLKSTI